MEGAGKLIHAVNKDFLGRSDSLFKDFDRPGKLIHTVNKDYEGTGKLIHALNKDSDGAGKLIHVKVPESLFTP